MTDDQMLTTEQLAERWNMQPATLEVWRQRSKGPAWVTLNDGPRAPVRYPLDGIVAYEKARTTTPALPEAHATA